MRPEKESIAKEIRAALESSSFSVLVDHKGMTVEKTEELRGRLREQDAKILVTKNAFLSRAQKDLGTDIGELTGPTAVVVGGELTAISKLLKGFIKERGMPSIKGGTLGTQVLTIDDVEEMANIPAREVLYGMLAGTLAAPMRQVAGVMHQKLCSLLYVLKAAEEKKSS